MFLGRRGFLTLAMASSLGVPYVVTSTSSDKSVGNGSSSAAPGIAGENPVVVAATEDEQPLVVPSRLPLEGVPVGSLGDVFRFDVSPRWVLGRWSRVMTVTPDATLQGYRVPLVSGIQEDDLAGSLTYYFNGEKRLERITFFGTTGDPRTLVSLMSSTYGLKRQSAPDPGLYLYQVHYNGSPVSEMRIQANPIMRATTPHERFKVELWLTRPNDFRMFSGQASSSVMDF
jgi:hypothetical protein